ncbi:hypothetical protein AAKU61_001387 [Undibacterium sp. GrIS 1.2]|uniref:antitoxin VbhA family protein n=1 Tax=Undibacterium sp. GrIS 1.2 TaxID=3143933 RepID=UPI003394C489
MINPTTKEQRQHSVDQANANMRLSGFVPNAQLLELQRKFIVGDITIEDMLDWNAAFARNAQRTEGQDIKTPKDAH